MPRLPPVTSATGMVDRNHTTIRPHLTPVPVILVHTERFAEHQTPPGHPERPERAEVFDVVASRWRERGVEVVAPRAATAEHLARGHDADYVRRIRDLSGRSAKLDPDPSPSRVSYEGGLLAAGGA